MEAPIYEVFLVLHPVSSRLGELPHALEPLLDGEAPFQDLDLYHRPRSDAAVIALRYDERGMSGPELRRLEDATRGAGLTFVDPARLTADERRAFFEVRLPQFEVVARGISSARDAAVALANRLGVTTSDGPTPAARRRLGSPPPLPVERASRLVVTIPPLPAGKRAGRAARGTDGPPRPPTLPPPPEPPDAAPRGKAGHSHTLADRLALSLAEQARLARRAAETLLRAGPPAVAHTPTEMAGPDTSPALRPDGAVELGVHGLDTARLASPRPADRDLPAAYAVVEDVAPPCLDVRFLRGSDWLPVRARSLSARGAYLVTGAPARLGDTVHVSIGCAGRTALIRGTVYHVTTADDAESTGASGFAIRFPEYACPARTQLVQVLLAARHAGIHLRPPPSRTAVRFPVRWPLQVHTAGGGFRAEALDVSTGGLFIATTRSLDVGAELRFAVPLDLADLPVEGAGRVTRWLSADEAEGRGMHAGCGVQILEMASSDRAAWEAFLGRVRRRSEKRLLVGAAAGRLADLAAGLAAAGYAVTSGSDLALLMRVAELDPCPPDMAVIDADLDQSGAPAGWLEQVFAARQVQCVTVRGDARRARSIVDRLLHVEA
jgi:hypothetical protein